MRGKEYIARQFYKAMCKTSLQQEVDWDNLSDFYKKQLENVGVDHAREMGMLLRLNPEVFYDEDEL
jgi:hypothetical protein